MKNRDLRERQTASIGFADFKSYILADLVAFHIVPLLFVMIKLDMTIAMTMMLMTLEPLYVVIMSLVYGWRKGFGWKFPLLTGVIFAPSVAMYYLPLTTPEEVMHALLTTAVFTLVYWVFAFGAAALASFARRVMKL